MSLSLSLSIVNNPQSHLLSLSEPLCNQPQQVWVRMIQVVLPHSLVPRYRYQILLGSLRDQMGYVWKVGYVLITYKSLS